MKQLSRGGIHPTFPKIRAVTSDRLLHVLVGVVAAAGVLVIYFPTTLSMIDTWVRSDTFAHGFLIAPISLFLIWRNREQLSSTPLQPNYWGLLALIGLGQLWFVAEMVSVLIVQQFCVIAMVIVCIWTIFGTQLTRQIAFPLAFLFLMVPAGEGLIPVLMEYTARVTVNLLRISGVPVYAEGTFFSIPGSNWEVAKQCSGLNYLVISFTIGLLFSFLVFQSWWRRAIFVLFSLILPLVANGLRAYMIVMFAYLSGSDFEAQADHASLGWIFHDSLGWILFGFMALLMFWIGMRWREKPRSGVISISNDVKPLSAKPEVFLSVTLATLGISLVWPVWANQQTQHTYPASRDLIVSMPAIDGLWKPTTGYFTDWKPHYVGADILRHQTYQAPSRQVGMHVAYYVDSRQGAEVVSDQNTMAQKNSAWLAIEEQTRTLNLTQLKTVRQTRLHSTNQDLIVWKWYWIGGQFTASPYKAKFIEAANKLLGNYSGSASIVVYTATNNLDERASQDLFEFLSSMLPKISESLNAEKKRGESEG